MLRGELACNEASSLLGGTAAGKSARNRTMSRSGIRTTALIAASVAVLSVCALLAMVSTSSHNRVMLEEKDMDTRYLISQGSGEKGLGFLKRLQEMWFVEDNGDHPELAVAASKIAGSVASAAFPDDMRDAIDPAVNPCDDFYEYACGTWVEDHKDKITPFQTRLAFSWDVASDRIRKKEVELLEKDDGPAGTFYRSCMDVDRVEKAAGTPLHPWLSMIDDITDMPSLVTAVVNLNKQDMDTLFTWYLDNNPHDSSSYAFFLDSSSGSLPDRSYYLDDTDEMKQHREAFLKIVTDFFHMVGRKNARHEAELVLALETKVATGELERAEQRMDHGTATTWDKIEALAPSWPWQSWLTQLGKCTPVVDGGVNPCTKDHEAVHKVGTHEGVPLLLRNKQSFPVLEGIISDLSGDNLEAIKAEMRWKLIRNGALYLSADFLDKMVELSKDLYGVQDKNPRPRKCYYSVTSNTPWPAAKLYTDKLFPHANRQAALEMLGNVRTQFMEALKDEPWMSEDDRKAAQHKLSEMFFQVAWPTDEEDKDAWPEPTTDMEGTMGPDLFINYMVISRMNINRELDRLEKSPKRRAWGGSTPLDVNAFYGPNNNGLWIPAGILQSPFFDHQNPDARNYGAIGSVLGHEMSHGFDDNGRQYDARGELHDWWDQHTVDAFKERSGCIRDVFSSYSIQGKHVNGKLTLGEDIADSGGLKFSWRAFLASGERTPAEKRTFFTAFAQTWCQVTRRKSALSSILTDTHAPAKFRVIGGLSQFPPFAEAFQCPTGSPMAPAETCKLW